MDWIKRNLAFVIGAVVALLLLGAAGWYSFSGWSNNAAQREEIDKAYTELDTLYASKPAPGDGKKVDNIKLAKEQQTEAREFNQKLATALEPVPAIPGGKDITIYAACVRAGVTPPANLTRTNLANRDFSAALQETIALLQREATNSSVGLPPRYKFSFEKQASLVTYAPGTVEGLAVQLGEVKAICDIINQAKVNFLEGIRRERIPDSPDDAQGPATDYLGASAITNELALITPYEITFRCFTPELADVVAGFAQSRYGLVVKAINVEPAPAGDPASIYGQPAQPVYYQQPVRPMAEESVYASRYGTPGANRYGTPGINRYGQNPQYPVQPVVQPTVAAAAPGGTRSGLQTLLKEQELKVTMLVHVIKLLPAQ